MQPGPADARPADFADYSAPVYRGPIAAPNFRGSGAKYRMFRTRIRLGAKGPNFAGHYAIVRIGCGAGCTNTFMVDLKTGRIFDFPLGGEDYYALDLFFRRGSRLLKGRWEDVDWQNGDNTVCNEQAFLWDGKIFRPLPARRRLKGQCPRWPGTSVYH